MAKELMWKHNGDQATAQGKRYSYRVFKSGGACGWVADKDGQPWEGYGTSDIVAAKRAAEEFAEKNDDFPRLLVTRNDGERVIVEINPEPGNLPTRVEVEMFIHHSGGVVVDIDANHKSNIDVDYNQATELIVRDGELASDESIPRLLGQIALGLYNVFSDDSEANIISGELEEFRRLVDRIAALGGLTDPHERGSRASALRPEEPVCTKCGRTYEEDDSCADDVYGKHTFSEN